MKKPKSKSSRRDSIKAAGLALALAHPFLSFFQYGPPDTTGIVRPSINYLSNSLALQTLVGPASYQENLKARKPYTPASRRA